MCSRPVPATSTTVAYRPCTALTHYILWLSSALSAKCAILIHYTTVVLGRVCKRLPLLLGFGVVTNCAFSTCYQERRWRLYLSMLTSRQPCCRNFNWLTAKGRTLRVAS